MPKPSIEIFSNNPSLLFLNVNFKFFTVWIEKKESKSSKRSFLIPLLMLDLLICAKVVSFAHSSDRNSIKWEQDSPSFLGSKLCDKRQQILQMQAVFQLEGRKEKVCSMSISTFTVSDMLGSVKHFHDSSEGVLHELLIQLFVVSKFIMRMVSVRVYFMMAIYNQLQSDRVGHTNA